ncbi:MAG: MBL fold metallo-hydrolase [Gallionellales bacterium 35-53-114]|jgi:metallo-beta-lactamase family protein|nr:MAG: MBL fold metallo-hydrolase [Gallionellales bacterium 35-53-114]OYZ65063.1 MAG: MBL fold metallo-hydrolase [Gallionellales bacterium 24-53-125]OZB07971.1 MAG: MBL fold metallo-hydrolase [Gallionellales bacterium 39-52-133]HQS59710.1 MBL fold metallo-hydrolase [Gallionellaceae bacterium]HQS76464.1 MBL fold metallo-hydrolase [Gallionellaceae bacterium]
MEIIFLGATGTVTGSKYLLSSGSTHVLIDCGLFQGLKSLRLRNWDRLPLDLASLTAVVLTHAHIDHSGYLPLLVKQGFKGKVYCSSATLELCSILLPDSGRLQEEQAEYANRHKISKHHPALPLYTQEDAELALQHLHAIDFEEEVKVGSDITFCLYPAGHIPGAASIVMRDSNTSIIFSGDLGRPDDPIMNPPTPLQGADYLVLESTYGNRKHPAQDALQLLGDIINRTTQREGVVVIPAFAVGRTQMLLHYLRLLKDAGTIPDIPTYLNSPMAVDATDIFYRHHLEHRLSFEQCVAACSVAKIVRTAEESKALNRRKGPMIIIAGSGMATGGRVVHHLKAFAPDPRNTILFAGFQAEGTRGAAMVGGAKSIRIHGEDVPVLAEIEAIDTLSAHADYAQIIEWLKSMKQVPRQVFVTHGEQEAATAMVQHIDEELHWPARVPEYMEIVQLS